MFVKCCLTIALLSIPCFAANTLAVFACPSKPTPGTDCLSRDLPGGKTLNIGRDDYYDVLIRSVCIDQPDSWWSQKLISLTATVTLASTPTPLKMPVYNERAPGSGCRIGITDFALYTSVPANGTPVALQVDVLRSDAQDGLKQLLNFATSQENNPAITTYAVNAVPYLNMGLTFANSVYSAFGQSTTPEIPMTATTLTPTSGLQLNSNDLRDSYLVEYSGPDLPKDRDLYVDDGGDLRWSANDSLVRGGSAWVVLRIQKREHRTDFVIRPWYKQWYALLEQVAQGAGGPSAVTVATFQKTTGDCLVLLEADGDFSDGDKRRFVSDYTSVEASIVTELSKPTPNYAAINQAIQAALDAVDFIQPAPPGQVVTATNTEHPTAPVAPGATLPAQRAVVPNRLVQELRTRLQ
ncbi:MAG: hypothetical protein WB729_05630 [Candidatus Sulfotelmatobacter sp.]